MRVAFCDKLKFKQLIMASVNLIRIKKKEFILTLQSFTPSDMNFKTILMPKSDFGNFFVTKSYSSVYILIFSAL